MKTCTKISTDVLERFREHCKREYKAMRKLLDQIVTNYLDSKE